MTERDDQQDTTWVEHGPTELVGPDPDTVRLGEQPTLADPDVPPPPAPAPPAPTPPAAAPPPAWPAPQWPAPAAPPAPAGWSSPSSAPGGPPPPAAAPAPSWPTPASAAPGQPPAAWTGAALPGVQGWGAVPQAPKPGVVPLRPLGLGEILDGSISYVRRDPRTVLGISVVFSMVIAVVQTLMLAVGGGSFINLLTDPAFLDPTTTDQSALVGGLAGLLTAAGITTLVTFVLQIVATGMLTVVMSRAVLGRRVSSREAWERVKPRFWALIGVTVLVGLLVSTVLVGGILLAVGLGAVIESAGGSGLGIVLGLLLGIGSFVAFGWLVIRYLLAPAVLVLERSGPVVAMRRSALLVKGAWWRTFGIYLLATILVGIVAQVLAFPLSFVLGLLPIFSDPTTLAFAFAITTGITTLLTMMITLPFTSGVVALLYIDRRIRREALDIELQRAAAAGQ